MTDEDSAAIGPIWWRASSPLGLLVAVGSVDPGLTVAVHPGPQALRRLVRPAEPRAVAGSQLTRTHGSGVEFADLRTFTVGDRARDVNWRATARRSSLWVNQRHPDRSTDVVLLVDTFADATLPDAVRVADALASEYLRRRDRVGLLFFGGYMGAVRAGAGSRQQRLVEDALLTTKVWPSHVDWGIDQIPLHTLPPNALVLAVSPLEDPRVLRLLADLRSRGIDVVVLEIPRPAGEPTPSGPGPTVADVALRLWALRQETVRSRLHELGIPVAYWAEGRPLAAAVEEVAAWPRAGRFVS